MLRLTRARAAISRSVRRAAAAQRTAVRRATTSSGSGGGAPASAPKAAAAGGGAGTALKVVGGVVTVVFGGAVAAVYGAPDWAFKQVLSRVAPAVKENADVEMSFADVKGSVSLFPPAVDMDFKGLRVQRPVLPGKLQSAFDITFDRFSVRATASGVRAASPGPVVERVVVDGMRGSFVRHPDSPPLPPVTFRQFAVDNAALAVSTVGGDPKAAPVPVVLEAFRSAPTGLRLHELPLSVAQSTIKGQLSGRPFVLQPLGPTLSNGARGQWSIRALPLSVLAPLAPAGSPLEWIGSGVTDINLITTFEQPDPKGPYTLRIDNTFSIGDVTAGVPASAPPLVKAVAAPVVAYLNSAAGGAGKFLHLPLTTALTQQQIEAAAKGAKPALTELARYFVADLGQQIADKAKGEVTAQAKELGAAAAKAGGQWLSSFLGGAAPAAAPAPAPAPVAAAAAAPAKPPVNSANSATATAVAAEQRRSDPMSAAASPAKAKARRKSVDKPPAAAAAAAAAAAPAAAGSPARAKREPVRSKRQSFADEQAAAADADAKKRDEKRKSTAAAAKAAAKAAPKAGAKRLSNGKSKGAAAAGDSDGSDDDAEAGRTAKRQRVATPKPKPKPKPKPNAKAKAKVKAKAKGKGRGSKAADSDDDGSGSGSGDDSDSGGSDSDGSDGSGSEGSDTPDEDREIDERREAGHRANQRRRAPHMFDAATGERKPIRKRSAPTLAERKRRQQIARAADVRVISQVNALAAALSGQV